MLFEYHIIFMKMILDAPKIDFAKSNLCLLTNVETFMGLDVIMPLLKIVHFLIKFAQLHDMFMCDFIAIVQICEGDVYWMYCDIHSFLKKNMFIIFHTLINYAHESINFH